jgi:hypothetical protein
MQLLELEGALWVIFHRGNKLVCYLKSMIASYNNEINQNFLCALPLLLTIWKKKIVKFGICMKQILVF